MADRYVARMFSGDWTEKDDVELAAWHAADPENAAALAASFEAFSGVEGLADCDELITAAAGHGRTPDRRIPRARRYTYHSPRTRRTILALTAASVAAVGLGLAGSVMHFMGTDVSLMRLETSVGQRLRESLPDGSIVMLNTDSAVIVDYSDDRRRLILDQGEVFFDVEKDASRPFTVEVGSRSITVSGTKFNVRKLPGYDLTVAVVEGAVTVHRREDRVALRSPIAKVEAPGPMKDAPDQYRLEAGAVVRLTDSGPPEVTISFEKTESYSTWRKGYVRFDGVPLHEVVREINRYTDKVIVLEDPGAMHLEVNAVLHLDRLDVIFDGLEGTLPVQVTRTPSRIVIRRKD